MGEVESLLAEHGAVRACAVLVQDKALVACVEVEDPLADGLTLSLIHI